MKKIILFTVLFLTIIITSRSQSEKSPLFCVFYYFLQMKKQNDPQYYEAFTDMYRQSKGTLNGNRSGVLTIPVVFHIVYNTDAQNLPDSVIYSQVQVLNEDYRRQNADAVNTREIFLPVAADTEIQFQLASVDPDGNPTNGITRTQTTRTGFEMNIFSPTNTLDEVKSTATGGTQAWDTNRYLNIWVCRIAPSFIGQVFGMSYPPAGLANWPDQSEAPAGMDGVIVHYTCVGRNSPVAGDDDYADNDMGRTLTHEVGHYLGLRHIWGDELFTNICSEDDGIEDTPLCGLGDQNACNYNANTCNADLPDDLPDMLENYMDYTKEHCYNMFTQGQKEHIRYVLQEKRPSLLTGEVLGINENPKQLEIALWPNPAKQQLNIKTDASDKATYTIVNLLGESIQTGGLRHSQIDISALSAGIYLFKINDRNVSSTLPFVVE